MKPKPISLTATAEQDYTGPEPQPFTVVGDTPFVLSSEVARGYSVSVRQFGALGNDVANDTAAIQSAIDAVAASGGGRVYVPEGTYRVSSTIFVASKVTLIGAGPGRSAIKQMTADTPVLASRSWHAASAVSPTGETQIRDLRILGATGANAHGIVLRDFYSAVENVHIYDCGGVGIRLTDRDSAGAALGWTMVENRIQNVLVSRAGGWGVEIGESDSFVTDGILSGVIVQAASGGSTGGIRIASAAGWQLTTIHTYGTFNSYGVDLSRCWHTVVNGAQIERGWTTAGLHLGSYQRGSSLDNISIAFNANGGTGVAVDGTPDSTYTADGLSIGALTLVQDYDAAATGVSWDRVGARVRVGQVSTQGTFQGRITLRGGWASSAIDIASARVYDGDGTGMLAAGVATMPRLLATSGAIQMTSGTLRLAYFTASQTALVSAIRLVTGTTGAGATPTLVRYGLYEVATNGDITLIGSTPNDTSLLTGTNTTHSKALSTPVTVHQGRRYAIGALVITGAAVPTVFGASALNATELSQSPRLAGIISGQTDLPASALSGTVFNSASAIYASTS